MRLSEQQAKQILFNAQAASYPNRDVPELLKPLYNYIEQVEAENAALRAELNETYIDENGETWFRPTAEAYYAVCKARNKWQEQSEEWRADLKRYKLWVNDLQSGMYVNCVYCGHRYGPADKVPVSMADALKEHIEHCPEHPMSKIKAEAERLREELAETREFAEAMLKERDIAFASNCKNRCARLEYLENKLDVASNEQLDNFLKKAYLISKLQHIQDYWNKDENEKAMSNALWHILDVVDDLLAGLEG